MEERKSTIKPEELLYEATKGLPDLEKMLLVGVARGLELSASVPKAG